MNYIQNLCPNDNFLEKLPIVSTCHISFFEMVPSIIFILSFPMCIFSLFKTPKYQNASRNWKFLVKLVMTGFSICGNAIIVIYYIYLYFVIKRHVNPIIYMNYLMALLTQILTILIVQMDNCRKNPNSSLLSIYWLITLLCLCLTSYSHFSNNSVFLGILHFWKIICVIALFMVFCLSEYIHNGNNKCPEVNASFLNRLTLQWLNGFVYKCWKSPIAKNDMWEIPHYHETKTLLDEFNTYWVRHVASISVKNYNEVDQTNLNERSPLVSVLHKPKKIGLFKILFKIYGKKYAIMVLFKSISDVTLVLCPLLQKFFIHYLETIHGFTFTKYFLAILFYPISIIGSLSINYMFTVASKIGVNVYATICAAIYEKLLKLSRDNCKDTGNIVNLMSIDAKDFTEAIMYSWIFFSSPLQIVLCSLALYYTVGICSVFGLGVLFILIPMNLLFMKKMNRHQVELMHARDLRVKMSSKILDGVKILKLYAWENYMRAKIEKIRNRELYHMAMYSYLDAIISFIWQFAPSLILLSIFLSYLYIHQTMNVTVVFVTLSLVNIVRFPVSFFPMMINLTLKSAASFRRLNAFFSNHEKEDYVKNCKNNFAITIKNGYFGSKNLITNILNNINVNIEKGKLTAIIGPIGSGKSTLLEAMMGETSLKSGNVNVDGTISFASQIPWLRNMNIRENIIFGEKYNTAFYDKVVSACSLKQDFINLINGDVTEISENGSNLSGGQKQRVCLARTVYMDRDIYIFDDVLSAVDAEVSQHIFKNVLSEDGILKDKTRILVTHSMTYLPQVDNIILLNENGNIEYQGSYDDSKKLTNFIEKTQTKKSKKMEKSSEIKIEEKKNCKKFEAIELEKVNTGNIKFSVFLKYIKQVGIVNFIVVCISYMSTNFCIIGTSIHLEKWSNHTQSYPMDKMGYRLSIYIAMVCGQAIFLIIYVVFCSIGFVCASKGLHEKIFPSLLRAPISFFHATPLGRIINRLGKDITILDKVIPTKTKAFLTSFFSILASLIVLGYTNYMALLFTIPLFVLYCAYQLFYIKSTRQLQRLDCATRSPIFVQFAETLAGTIIIRTLKVEQKFIIQILRKINLNNAFSFATAMLNRWLAVRLDLIGNTIVLVACLVSVYKNLSSTMSGLMITYCLSITSAMSWMIRMKSDLETNAVSIERLVDYIDLESEGQLHNKKVILPYNWPSSGKIEFKKYSMQYKPDLPFALNNVYLTIKSNEKIGIVGRTGSGKSTLALSLFRIYDLTFGSIKIDDVDISTLGLHQLRSRISIIPQDPVVFSFSIRDNLDPNRDYTDNQIWRALELCHLKNFVISQQDNLLFKCGDYGSNLSVGQKQLLCIGRAILENSKILVLDEATASIDFHTDQLIQETIKTNFKNCTILTVAHRLNTIMDYDKILVMDNGTIAEFDTIPNLKQKNGIFAKLLKDANL